MSAAYNDSTPAHIPQRHKESKKRSREGDEWVNHDFQQPANSRVKRQRQFLEPRYPSEIENDAVENPPYIPVIDVEDISDEVEARLKLKEEARRNRMGKKDRKRKRDSTGSVTGNSTGVNDAVPKRKRSKLTGDPGRNHERGQGAETEKRHVEMRHR
ncbi:predicted protein [Uncinocarpus reesii 1704]|uniref:Uncharacterized protein n=1 Tax=Uncinocarpus reesii (strain UAMH 1704) TaxID=336963 RepID=C4JUP0_UNCRE|nr:uncharacterized protein UREG_04843 [Uncinocarpus reesii 1704]EEP80001.1 predicted protein [Uncinocarpus reesii 1704]